MRVSAGAGGSLRLRVPPEARYSRQVRRELARFAADHHLPDDDAEEFLAAVSEALSNAIKHSRTACSIEVTCRLSGGNRLVATVVDDGVGFDASAWAGDAALPHVMAERGRGLPLIKRYTDYFEVRSEPGKGTSVILERIIARTGKNKDDDIAS